MKKFLTILSLTALLGCSLPASAREPYRPMPKQPPRHEKVVVQHRNPAPSHYVAPHHRTPIREAHYYHHSSSKTGAIAGGIVAGAMIFGVIAALAD